VYFFLRILTIHFIMLLSCPLCY